MFIVERQSVGRGKWYWIVMALGMFYCLSRAGYFGAFGFAALTMHIRYTPAKKKSGEPGRA
jgi:hypothetical protein